jgi:putative transposase
MAEIEKKTKRYPIDLTDEEWARIEPFLPARGQERAAGPDGFARGFERDPISAGPLGWRMLPKDFPPWPTV